MTEKTQRLHALSSPGGIINALAIDQRRSLRLMLARASGQTIDDAQLASFKRAVTAKLSPHVTAVLVDPEYGCLRPSYC